MGRARYQEPVSVVGGEGWESTSLGIHGNPLRVSIIDKSWPPWSSPVCGKLWISFANNTLQGLIGLGSLDSSVSLLRHRHGHGSANKLKRYLESVNVATVRLRSKWSHLSLAGAPAASQPAKGGAVEGARPWLSLAYPPQASSRKLRVLGRWLFSPSHKWEFWMKVLCGGK